MAFRDLELLFTMLQSSYFHNNATFSYGTLEENGVTGKRNQSSASVCEQLINCFEDTPQDEILFNFIFILSKNVILRSLVG